MKRHPQELYSTWVELRRSQPGLHALELAAELEVSECELLASACGAAGDLRATRLAADWASFLRQLPGLGFVKAVTRNPNAVIEVEGEYGNVEFFGAMGQSVSSIDLRIFLNHWRFAFAVSEETKRGTSRSLQFFDGAGRAIHKLYLRERSNVAAFDALVLQHTADDQAASQLVESLEAPPSPKSDLEIDVVGLRNAWLAMTDSHEFFGILRRFEVTRTQALRLAGGELAVPLVRGALERVLAKARDAELPFMTFVGNLGVVQIHTGVVKKVAPMGPWINVLDPGFDLHVRSDRVDEAWLVRKPTLDGNVTALELYDEAGQQIALLVGQRKPGTPENLTWRRLLESLPQKGA